MPHFRYHCDNCGKTYIGQELNTAMLCLCTPPRKIQGQLQQTPLSDALLEMLDIGSASKLRASLCQSWGIPNKSHATHGSNFSTNQRVVDLILDIVAPVTGGLRTTVRNLIISKYKYDIDSKEMLG
ncbi:hypothetical protein SAMN05216596_101403 [Pseudomonas congelans]|uniref:Uncharacterized protein n=1 Tax=Pseudomonas congelans TaxID=200452 RepID=A0A1H0JME0_9PSED|nr:hypothetical protein [Pseudomonas congelans]SDO44702.1 hypothetical protein SAMN05216596_101403 [Pseudomonas congelans]